MTPIFFVFCGIFALAFGLPLESQSQDSAPGFIKLGANNSVAANGKYYFASTTARDQDAAEKACHSFVNGRLATVRSRAEFDEIANSLPPSGIDSTTYFTAGRKVGGSWFYMTTGELVPEALLFWDPSGIYPIGLEGAVMSIRKYGDSIPSSYSDSWGFKAQKQYVCEAGYYNP